MAAWQNGEMGNFGRKHARYFSKPGRFFGVPPIPVPFSPGGARSAGEGSATIGANHRLKAEVPTRLCGDGAEGGGQTLGQREHAAPFAIGTTISGARPA